jgi:hypothetical protein
MCSGNHPGPMKALTTITLRGSKKTAQGGFDPIASRSAADVRGRAFLSEHADDNRSRYNKGG